MPASLPVQAAFAKTVVAVLRNGTVGRGCAVTMYALFRRGLTAALPGPERDVDPDPATARLRARARPGLPGCEKVVHRDPRVPDERVRLGEDGRRARGQRRPRADDERRG